MPSTHYVAYVNSDGRGVAFASGRLLDVVQAMQKSPGFYLVKRADRNIGMYTSQQGFVLF